MKATRQTLPEDFEQIRTQQVGVKFHKVDLHFHTPASSDALGINKYAFNPYAVQFRPGGKTGEADLLSEIKGVRNMGTLKDRKDIQTLDLATLSLLENKVSNDVDLLANIQSYQSSKDVAKQKELEARILQEIHNIQNLADLSKSINLDFLACDDIRKLSTFQNSSEPVEVPNAIQDIRSKELSELQSVLLDLRLLRDLQYIKSKVPGEGYPKTEREFQDRILAYARVKADQMVAAFLAHGISLVAVTDHNGFGTLWSDEAGEMDLKAPSWYEILDEAAQSANQRGEVSLVILPGVEISCSGAHILAIFPPEVRSRGVQFTISNVLRESGIPMEEFCRNDAVATISPFDAAGLIARSGGIAIPAHVDGAYQELHKIYKLNAGAIESLVGNSHVTAVEVLDPVRFADDRREAKFASIRRDSGLPPLTYVQCSDAHDLAGIGQRFTYLKMEVASFAGLQAALEMPASRVRIPASFREPDGLYLHGMLVDHPFLGKQVLRFNQGINCITGNRGAGKTTLFSLLQAMVWENLPDLPGIGSLFLKQVQSGQANYYVYQRSKAGKVTFQSFDPKTGRTDELGPAYARDHGLRPGFFNEDRILEIIRSNQELQNFLRRHFGTPSQVNLEWLNDLFSIPGLLGGKKEPLLQWSANGREYVLALNLQWRSGPASMREFLQLSVSQRLVAIMCMILVSGRFGPLIVDEPETLFDDEDINRFLLPVLQQYRDRRQVLFFAKLSRLIQESDPDNIIVMQMKGSQVEINSGMDLAAYEQRRTRTETTRAPVHSIPGLQHRPNRPPATAKKAPQTTKKRPADPASKLPKKKAVPARQGKAIPNIWLVTADPQSFQNVKDPTWRFVLDKTVTWSPVGDAEAHKYLEQARAGDIVLAYYSSDAVNGITGVGRLVEDPRRSGAGFAVALTIDTMLAPEISLQDLGRATPELDHVRRAEKGQRLLRWAPMPPWEWSVIRAMIVFGNRGLNKSLPPSTAPAKSVADLTVRFSKRGRTEHQALVMMLKLTNRGNTIWKTNDALLIRYARLEDRYSEFKMLENNVPPGLDCTIPIPLRMPVMSDGEALEVRVSGYKWSSPLEEISQIAVWKARKPPAPANRKPVQTHETSPVLHPAEKPIGKEIGLPEPPGVVTVSDRKQETAPRPDQEPTPEVLQNQSEEELATAEETDARTVEPPFNELQKQEEVVPVLAEELQETSKAGEGQAPREQKREKNSRRKKTKPAKPAPAPDWLKAEAPPMDRSVKDLPDGQHNIVLQHHTTIWSNLQELNRQREELITTATLDIHLHPSQPDLVRRKASLLENEPLGEPGRSQPPERYYALMLLRRTVKGVLQPLETCEGVIGFDQFAPLMAAPEGSLEYGRTLYNDLFDCPAPAEDQQQTVVAKAGQKLLVFMKEAIEKQRLETDKLHITLRIDSAQELHQVQWEYLYSGSGYPLACDPATPFSRFLLVPSAPPVDLLRIMPGQPLSILLALASPAELGTSACTLRLLRGLDAIPQKQILDLGEILADLPHVADPRSSLLVRQDGCAVTLEALCERLRSGLRKGRPFHVLHLACHGLEKTLSGEPGLVLEQDGGQRADIVSDEKLALALSEFLPPAVPSEKGLRLVVLAACHSARSAGEAALGGVARRLIAAGVPAVVAMQGAVSYKALQFFSHRLYSSLLEEGYIDRAVNAARQYLRVEAKADAFDTSRSLWLHEWGLPVLFMRLADGRLLVPSEEVSSQARAAAEQRVPVRPFDPADARELAAADAQAMMNQWEASLGVSLTPLVQAIREVPAPVLKQKKPEAQAAKRKPGLFRQPGQECRRWALVKAAREHRGNGARRSVLFLREQARKQIEHLIDTRQKILELQASIYYSQIWSPGYLFIDGRNYVLEKQGTGSSTGRLSLIPTGVGPPAIAQNKSLVVTPRALRDVQRRLSRDQLLSGSEQQMTYGNLIWPAEDGRDCPASDERADLAQFRQGIVDLLDTPEIAAAALGDATIDQARQDCFKVFEKIVDQQIPGLDAAAASLLLHTRWSDDYAPYHPKMASDVMAILWDDRAAPYSAGYAGYCHLVHDLLADSELGFASLADVSFFLQRLVAHRELWDASSDYPRNLLVNLGEPVALSEELMDSQLVTDPDVLPRAMAALSTGKHIILIGPPGTGKTTLAEDICRLAFDQNFSRGYSLITATADWTTFDTIGGYMPSAKGKLRFHPGVFLEAIRQEKWLIIDEINRADIDKAFGELFTVLSGQAVTLPYLVKGEPVRILPAGSQPTGRESDFIIHPSWRIIGTMNVYDKATLFAMSYAFMRRFAFVDVDIPGREEYKLLLRHFFREAGLKDQQDDTLRQQVERTFQPDEKTQENPLMRWRSSGPAIARDMIAYLANRRSNQPANSQSDRKLLAEALLLYMVPQFDGLEIPSIKKIYDHLKTALLQDEAEIVLKRIRELFPYITDWTPETGKPENE